MPTSLPRKAVWLAPLLPALACTLSLLLFPAAASRAQPDAFTFHGLRVGMRLEAIAAAGYGLEHRADTALSAQGYSVASGLPEALDALTLYLYNHELFQIDATYPPVRGSAALAFVAALRKANGAPEDGSFDPLHDKKWSWRGMTFHYSPGIRDDGALRPNLLITDEVIYRKALEMKLHPPRNLVY